MEYSRPSTRVDNPKLREKSQHFTDYTHTTQRSYKFTPSVIVQQLNLDTFKTHPCNITTKHNHKHCHNYHNEKDRRRPGNFYSRSLCPNVQNGVKCPQGDQCLYSHSLVEKQYHIESYRKCFCTHWPNSIQKCPYGQFCAYAHCEEQIQAKLINNYVHDEDFYMFYYKTEFCVMNLTEHDKKECVYAHNWQDYRRDPSIYSYEPIPCINWRTTQTIYDYMSGCENGAGCNMCHGWKELSYHPLYYKTNKCQEKDCRKDSCPNYHSEKQRRTIPANLTNKSFKLVAKNRITEGVFKDSLKKQGFIPKNDKVHTMIYSNNKRCQLSSRGQSYSKSVINLSNDACYHEKQEKWLQKEPIQSDYEDSSSQVDNDDSSLEKIQQQVQKLLQ